jgi:ethanolamine utilization protein EutN
MTWRQSFRTESKTSKLVINDRGDEKMIFGKVVGNVVATIKNDRLKGLKLLVVQTYENKKPRELLVAADTLENSGLGNDVYLVGSRDAGIALGGGQIPIDAGIVGIIDHCDEKSAKK